MIVSGQPEDYDRDRLDSIRATFASLGNVPVEAVIIKVLPASVRIQVTINAADEDAVAELEQTLIPSLNTASAASSTFGIAVEVTPSVQRTVTTSVVAASPSQFVGGSDAAAIKRDDDGDNNTVIIGASVGGAAALAMVLLGLCICAARRARAKPSNVLVKPVPNLVQLQMNSTSTTTAFRHHGYEDEKNESREIARLHVDTSTRPAAPRGEYAGTNTYV